MTPNPYEVLGIAPGASETELRAAYRRAVMRHHPDHNGGSPEAARRFEAVQTAYAQIRRERTTFPSGAAASAGAGAAADPDLEARLAKLEQQLRREREETVRQARAEREEAVRQARTAAAASEAAHLTAADSEGPPPTDEELGYVRTEDSFSQIFDDFVDSLHRRLAGEEP